MDPRDLLEQYALPLASLVAMLVVLRLVILRRRARRRRAADALAGPGVALALALDGDLDRAARLLEHRLKLGGKAGLDALIGLLAVLRSQGDHQRAHDLLERLAERQQAPWLDAMRVRLALDEGRLHDACRLVDEGRDIPIETTIATLARAGRWTDALRRYRQAVGRRHREKRVEAVLAAGCAAQLTREGHVRSARRALKRALALAPEGLLTLAVAARMHPRATDRHRYGTLLADRMPNPGETTARPELSKARRLDADGRRQAALGVLRDALEAQPRAWDIRQLYARWIVESGEPADWRAELAELVDLLVEHDEQAPGARCTACGLVTEALFAICPRCDALGSADVLTVPSTSPAPALSVAGTTLSDIVGLPDATDEDLPVG